MNEIHPTIWRAIIDLLLQENSTPLNGKYWARRSVAVWHALRDAEELRSLAAVKTCVSKILLDYDEDGVRQRISVRIDPSLPANRDVVVLSELDPAREFTLNDRAFVRERWNRARRRCPAPEAWSKPELVRSLAIMLNVNRTRVHALLADMEKRGAVRPPKAPSLDRIPGT